MRHGFVRFARGTVVYPGFQHLRAVYHSRPKRGMSVAKVAGPRVA
jgi:hypothetical protein